MAVCPADVGHSAGIVIVGRPYERRIGGCEQFAKRAIEQCRGASVLEIGAPAAIESLM